MKIVSWNVNGIRAIERKGFLEWLAKEKPDIVCLQETKAMPEQLSEALQNPPSYYSYFNSAERKGYSGVAIFTREKPIAVQPGFGIKKFDTEGRALLAEYAKFFLLNIYFPNGKKDDERLQYKMDFYDETLKFAGKLAKKKPIITCGDYNTAHKPIDLAHPKENEDVSGFLPIERAWIDKWIAAGNVDVFREFCPLPGHYTWWDLKTGARARNVGWRIDYHFVSKQLVSLVEDASIHPEIMGSDHCPISIDLKI